MESTGSGFGGEGMCGLGFGGGAASSFCCRKMGISSKWLCNIDPSILHVEDLMT